MNKDTKKNEEKKFIAETAKALSSDREETVIAKLNELKSTGRPSILPLILELLNISNSEKIVNEVILIISNLKDQNCVPHIVKFIQNNQQKSWIDQVISACWQSSLNYSNNLNTFTDCFIIGNYQVALESFTVIEEMLWQTSDTSIKDCKHLLTKNSTRISIEKKPLYDELIKVLDEGKSRSHEEYTDILE